MSVLLNNFDIAVLHNTLIEDAISLYIASSHKQGMFKLTY